MAVNVRVRNGMEPDAYGSGGVTEADIRGGVMDLIVGEGVIDVSEGYLLVHESASPDMNVIVDKGTGYIPNDSYDEYDSDSIKYWEAVVSGVEALRTLAIGANSSGSTRIDLVCLKIDAGATPDNEGSDVAELIVVVGTPGAGVPATPAYHLKLAEVSVIDGATEIEDADITDSRTQIRLKANVSISNEKYIDYSPTTGSTTTLDLSLSNDHRITMPEGNITIALSNARIGQKFMVSITQPAGGSRTVTWFSTIKWEDGFTPVLTVTANKRDKFGFEVMSAGQFDGVTIGLNH